MEPLGLVRLLPDVVARPQPAEVRALDRQLADRLDQLRVVGVDPGGDAQAADGVDRDALPVRVELAGVRVQEHQPDQITAVGVPGEQRLAQRVVREHLEAAAEHERGRVRPAVHQPKEVRADLLPPPCAPAAGRRRLRQPVQVGGGVLVEGQPAGQRVEDLRRGVALPALFQAHVVVGADAGQHRDLLAAQARHPPRPAGGQAKLRRSHLFAAGAEELSERVFLGHAPRLTPIGPGRVAAPHPPSRAREPDRLRSKAGGSAKGPETFRKSLTGPGWRTNDSRSCARLILPERIRLVRRLLTAFLAAVLSIAAAIVLVVTAQPASAATLTKRDRLRHQPQQPEHVRLRPGPRRRQAGAAGRAPLLHRLGLGGVQRLRARLRHRGRPVRVRHRVPGSHAQRAVLRRLVAAGPDPRRRQRPGRHPVDGRLRRAALQRRPRTGLRHRVLLRRDDDERPRRGVPGRVRRRLGVHGRARRLLRHHRRVELEQPVRQRPDHQDRAAVGRPGPADERRAQRPVPADAAVARHRRRHPALPELRRRDQAVDEPARGEPDAVGHRPAAVRLDAHPLRQHRRAGAGRGDQRPGRRARAAAERDGGVRDRVPGPEQRFGRDPDDPVRRPRGTTLGSAASGYRPLLRHRGLGEQALGQRLHRHPEPRVLHDHAGERDEDRRHRARAGPVLLRQRRPDRQPGDEPGRPDARAHARPGTRSSPAGCRAWRARRCARRC